MNFTIFQEQIERRRRMISRFALRPPVQNRNEAKTTGKKNTMKTNVKNLLLNGTMACALALLPLGAGSATAQTTKSAAPTAPVKIDITAIDICLEPDATII